MYFVNYSGEPEIRKCNAVAINPLDVEVTLPTGIKRIDPRDSWQGAYRETFKDAKDVLEWKMRGIVRNAESRLSFHKMRLRIVEEMTEADVR